MNQKQREYIVRQLKEIKEKKITSYVDNNATSDNSIVEELCSLVKSGDLIAKDKGNITDDNNIRANSYISGARMATLIKRSVGSIDNYGNFLLESSSLIRAIKELPANAWNVFGTYGNSDLRRFANSIKSCVKNPDLVDSVVNTDKDKDKAYVKSVNDAYVEAERKIMLSDSDELIKVIKEFEEKEF